MCMTVVWQCNSEWQDWYKKKATCLGWRVLVSFLNSLNFYAGTSRHEVRCMYADVCDFIWHIAIARGRLRGPLALPLIALNSFISNATVRAHTRSNWTSLDVFIWNSIEKLYSQKCPYSDLIVSLLNCTVSITSIFRLDCVAPKLYSQ